MNAQTKLDLDREGWLIEAAEFILDDIIRPQMADDWQPPFPFRVSVGYPPRTRVNTKTVACCIKAEASADQHNEIFVSPSLNDSLAMLEALAHEMVHYSDNCESGHQNHFARVARRIGLEGKLTATKAGPKLTDQLNGIIKILGPIPHAKIDLGKATKKQSTRMLKVACPSDDCGFSYRTSQTNINKITDWLCPACAIEDMTTE